MTIQSEKTRNVLIMIALSLSTVAMMGDMVIIPIAENLFTDFSGANAGLLNFILSGPALIGAFASLLCGKLMYYVNKKTILLGTFGIFMAAAICGDLIHEAWYVAVMRAFAGIGMGGVGVTAMAIIADVFIDEKKRSAMMGIYNGMMAATGALLGWVSGMVAAVQWRMVFRVYLASIPILVIILLFIPKDKKADAAGENTTAADGKMPWARLLLLDGAFVVYSIVYCIIYYQIAMVVMEKALGDAALIGLLSALGTVGSFAACCSFGAYYNVLKRFTPFIGFVAMAASYFLLYAASGAVPAMIACTVLGAAFGIGISYYMMYCTVIVPPSQIPMSISITTMVMSIGTFLSTYVSTLLQAVTGVSTITGIIPFLIAVLAVGAVISLIAALKSRRNPQ